MTADTPRGEPGIVSHASSDTDSGNLSAVAGLFDAMASSYDSHEPWYAHLYDVLHSILLEELRPPAASSVGYRSLDVGCGTGLQTILLERLGYESHGIDISTGLLAVARRRLASTILAVGSAEDIPYPSHFFDVVTCCGSVLSFLKHPERAITEVGRVLRPGGRLLLECEHKWNLDLAWAALNGLSLNALGYDVTLRDIIAQLWRPLRKGFHVDYPFPMPDGTVSHMKLRLFTLTELDDHLKAAGLRRRSAWGIHMFTNLIPSTVLHRETLPRPLATMFRLLGQLDQVVERTLLARVLANSIVILAERPRS